MSTCLCLPSMGTKALITRPSFGDVLGSGSGAHACMVTALLAELSPQPNLMQLWGKRLRKLPRDGVHFLTLLLTGTIAKCASLGFGKEDSQTKQKIKIS